MNFAEARELESCRRLWLWTSLRRCCGLPTQQNLRRHGRMLHSVASCTCCSTSNNGTSLSPCAWSACPALARSVHNHVFAGFRKEGVHTCIDGSMLPRSQQLGMRSQPFLTKELSQVLVPFDKTPSAKHKILRTSLYGMDAEDTACVSEALLKVCVCVHVLSVFYVPRSVRRRSWVSTWGCACGSTRQTLCQFT